MRVVILGRYPEDKNKILGGTSAVAWRLAESLSQQPGVEVHAVVPVKGLAAERHETCGLVHEHYFPSNDTLGGLTYFALDRMRAHRLFREIRPDIVHVHSATYYPVLVWHTEWPWVLTLHGMMEKEVQLRRGIRSKLSGKLSLWREKQVFREVRDVILISDYVVPFVEPHTKARLHAIPNPIADTYFSIPNEESPGALLFVGWITPRKGLMFLLKTMNELKRRGCRCRVSLVGKDREPDYVASLRAYIDEHELHDYVDWLGTVEEEKLLDLYSRCSVFVLPSIEETLPVSIGQAMAAGKPVVGARSAGIPFMVQDGVTGLLADYDDVTVMADNIERLLGDPGLRARMGREGRRVAEDKYSGEGVARQHLEVYQQAIDDRRKR